MAKNIYLYYLFTFLRNCAFFAAVLVPFYTEWGKTSLFQAQLLQSWFVFCVFALEVPTGALADRFGRKYSLFLGALIHAIAAVIYGLVPNLALFVIGEFFFAAGIALMSGADNALIYDLLKENNKENERKKIFGRAYAFSMLGMLISAPLGGFIASTFGLNYPMIFTVVPGVAAAITALFIKEAKKETENIEGKNYFQIVRKGLIYFAQHKKLRLMTFDAIIISSTAYFVIWLYQPVLQKINLPISSFGLFHAGLVVAEIIIAASFLWLEKFVRSSRHYLLFTAIATSLGFFLVSLNFSLWTVIFFIILSGGFGLTRFEYMSALMNEHIPSAQRATIISTISMLRRFVLVFLNPLVGLLADRNLPFTFLFLGLLSLFVIIPQYLKSKLNKSKDD